MPKYPTSTAPDDGALHADGERRLASQRLAASGAATALSAAATPGVVGEDTRRASPPRTPARRSSTGSTADPKQTRRDADRRAARPARESRGASALHAVKMGPPEERPRRKSPARLCRRGDGRADGDAREDRVRAHARVAPRNIQPIVRHVRAAQNVQRVAAGERDGVRDRSEARDSNTGCVRRGRQPAARTMTRNKRGRWRFGRRQCANYGGACGRPLAERGGVREDQERRHRDGSLRARPRRHRRDAVAVADVHALRRVGGGEERQAAPRRRHATQDAQDGDRARRSLGRA